MAETDPLGATATAAYDAVGRTASVTDRLGRRRDFAFDADGRMTTETWYASGGALAQTQTHAYDAVGNRLSAADPDGTYTFAYDALRRVLTANEPFGQTLTNTYDAVGNRVVVQDSQGGTTTSTFDSLNRLTARQVGGTGVTAIKETRGYDGAGQLTAETRYSWSGSAWTGIGTSTFAYDAAGRLTGHRDADGSNATLASYSYSYDGASRLTAVTTNGATQSYGYDSTDQVTNDNGTSYTYDANGNRTMSGYSTGGGNRTTNDGTWTYTYDADGSVTKRSKGASAETWVYAYDQRGQMASAIKSATDGGAATTRVTYVYDAFGNRIETDTWDGTTTTVERFAFDGWDTAKPSPVGNENFDAWADLDGSNALVTRRVYGTGFDELVARQSAVGTVAWYLADHQGSVRQLVDNSGSVIGTLAYDAFGKVLNGTGAIDRYRYTGRESDSTLELMHYRSRIYNPASGKMLSVDRKGFAAGDVNLYRYVGNQATTGRDPSGMQQPGAKAPEPKPNDISFHQISINEMIDRDYIYSRIRSGDVKTEKDNWDESYVITSDTYTGKARTGVSRTVVQMSTSLVYRGEVTQGNDGKLMFHMVILTPYQKLTPLGRGSRSETIGYKVLRERHTAIDSGETLEAATKRLTGVEHARLEIARYKEGRENDRQTASSLAALEFFFTVAHVIPGVAAANHALDGNTDEMWLSIAGDLAIFVGGAGIALKGTRAGRALFVASQGTQGSLAVTRAVQAYQAYDKGHYTQAGHHLSETFLRLLGVTVSQVAWTKAKPRFGESPLPPVKAEIPAPPSNPHVVLNRPNLNVGSPVPVPGPKTTFGELFPKMPDDAWFHLSAATPAEVQAGVSKGVWVKWKEIRELTPEQFRFGVVGGGGAGNDAAARTGVVVLAKPGDTKVFLKYHERGYADVPEWLPDYRKVQPKPDIIVTLPEVK